MFPVAPFTVSLVSLSLSLSLSLPSDRPDTDRQRDKQTDRHPLSHQHQVFRPQRCKGETTLIHLLAVYCSWLSTSTPD
ncbi:hypothetical protein LX32DRAFT_1572 [Colletotrichum zoysiae]|uniref:Secreted protein n=1 Tax=Colletotrichum zoysiae TaxID=1216348 RepID=A0AAD9MAL1_9PEZI|nr:hypothetical protein LX32DRAFT_1572 [Colletotrichum zoysiae]